jgi:hypothetical protein
MVGISLGFILRLDNILPHHNYRQEHQLQHSLGDISHPNHDTVRFDNRRQHKKVNNQEGISTPHCPDTIGNLDRNPEIKLGDALKFFTYELFGVGNLGVFF